MSLTVVAGRYEYSTVFGTGTALDEQLAVSYVAQVYAPLPPQCYIVNEKIYGLAG